MERALTRQGPHGRQSYTVTLPKDWVQRHGLDEEQSVELVPVGDTITVKPPEQTRDVQVDGTTHTADSLAKALSMQYRLGADTITVTYTDQETYTAVKQIVQDRLMGFEILGQEENTVTIQDLSKEKREEFAPVLRRLFRQVVQMSEYAAEGNSEQVTQLEDSVNRLSNYARRLLVKEGHTDYRKTPLYYSLIQELERQADDIKHHGSVTDEVASLFQALYRFMYEDEPGLDTLLHRIEKENTSHDTVRRRLSGMLGVIYGIHHTATDGEENMFKHGQG